MNYRELLYKNALKTIGNIYTQSKYDPDVDLYRAFDVINSVNENQFKSKEWLIQELVPIIRDKKNEIYDICVLGSWYGLISFLLREQLDRFNIKPHIHNVDSDPETMRFARLLFEGMNLDKTHFIVEDAEEWILDNVRKCNIIVNTSCEHMEPDDILLITQRKKPNDIICFQGNNYHEIQSHINTHNSLDEFVDSLKLVRVFYKGILKAEEYDRYMVIGI